MEWKQNISDESWALILIQSIRRRIHTTNKGKQQLSEGIFRKAYLHLGLHYPLPLVCYHTLFQNFLRMAKFWTKTSKSHRIIKLSKKSHDVILDSIILLNLDKFKLSRSFWTWVISIFVKYQKLAILCFWPIFDLHWSHFFKL